MQCAVIVPTLQPSDVLNNCITSMLKGGYDEDIYVVSHDERIRGITTLGDKIRFVKADTDILATDTLIHKGFLSFDKKYDLIIYAHNDVVFHDMWWSKLKELWSSVPTDKIWSISVPMIGERILVNNPQQKLGLGFDIYNIGFHGRFSPCTSFLYSSYADVVNKYGGDTYFSMELLLFYESILQHKWGMLANNGCFIEHKGSVDTRVDEGRFNKYLTLTYHVWFAKFGYNLEHFISIWFNGVLKKHTNEIIDGINSGNYDSLDYIFNEGVSMLGNTNCKKCDLGKTCRCFDKLYREWQ